MMFRIALVCCGLAVAASADTISFGGVIIQSTQHGTGPAVDNPSLNNIQDLQAYTTTLTFAGSITAPGTYAPAMESGFDFN
jgi:hypothetical protein